MKRPDEKVHRVVEALLKQPELAIQVRECLMEVQFVGPWEEDNGSWYRYRNLSQSLWGLHYGFADEISLAVSVEEGEHEDGQKVWHCQVFKHLQDEACYSDSFESLEDAKHQVDQILKWQELKGLPHTVLIG